MPSPRFQRPVRVTVVQSIIDQILGQIRDKTLRPGDKLPSERELIAALGVSRSSVREALQGLVAMNVIESRPGEGTFVKTVATTSPLWNLGDTEVSVGLEKQMRLDLLQTRWVVDEAIALIAMERATEEDLRSIRDSLAAYEQAMGQDDGAVLVESHNRIHLAIAHASGNFFLNRVVEMLLGALPSSLRNPEYEFTSEQEREFMLANETRGHRRIYEAIASREPDRVREAIREHMEFARKFTEGAFDRLLVDEAGQPEK